MIAYIFRGIGLTHRIIQRFIHAVLEVRTAAFDTGNRIKRVLEMQKNYSTPFVLDYSRVLGYRPTHGSLSRQFVVQL